MSKAWPLVALGEVLAYRKEFIQIEDLKTYKRCRVQLHAQGIVLRDSVAGAEIKTKKQQVCKAGEFLVAEIDAKVGGFGIVPDELDGAIVSSHYFLFSTNESRLDRRFLGYYVRTHGFRGQVAAQGSTNYAAIRPRDVLGYTIPLPLLDEQQRIVARIEELEAKIVEAQGLRRQAVAGAEALISASLSDFCRSSAWELSTIESLIGEEGLRNGKSVRPSDDGEGIRCLTLSAMRNGRIDIRNNKPIPLSLSEANPYLIKKGDVFVVRGNGSKELCGLAGLVPEDCNGVIFPDLFIRVPIPSDQISPEFFVLAWNSAPTREIIEEKAKTTSGIWKINQGHILSTKLPIPPIPEQRRLVAYLDGLQAKMHALKHLHAQTGAELDAMLPSILDKAFQGILC